MTAPVGSEGSVPSVGPEGAGGGESISPVLVTGATSGVGRACVDRLSSAGATVYLLARPGPRLDRAAEASGGVPVPCDVTADPSAVHEAVDPLSALPDGPPAVLVNAAGIFSLAPFAETDPTEFERHLQVNLRGAFLVIRALLPGMLERGKGLVVNVGSVAGRKALPGNAAYGASKFGLRGLHEVLLEEIRGTGVRATLVEPAATDTPLWDELEPDEDPTLPDRDEMLRPDDVARAVHFVVTTPGTVRIPLLQIERA